MRLILLALLALILAGLIWVRIAPVDADDLHRSLDVDAPGDDLQEGGFTAVRRLAASGPEVLKAVEEIAATTPRTRRIAGSVEEGRITYETRTRWIGFPDYTTVEVVDGDAGPLLAVHARLRFGRSDLGVNRRRVTYWLERLGPLVAPLS